MDIVYGYAANPPAPAAPATYRMIRGDRAFFGYTTAPDGRTWWFARVRGQAQAASPSEWRDVLLAALTADESLAADIVRASGDRVIGGTGYDVPSLPHWHTPALTIVGDAAHAAAPAAAQGASMAAEDAIVLAKCLRDLPTTARAFATYEALRRERVESLVAASAEINGPQGSAAASRSTGGQNWLDYPLIDWDSPVPHQPGLQGRQPHQREAQHDDQQDASRDGDRQ